MGCIPSSTYPEHLPRHDGASLAAAGSGRSGQSGSDFVYSRQVSTGLAVTTTTAAAGTHHASNATSHHNFVKSDSLPVRNFSSPYTPSEAPPLRVQSQGDVGADGIGLASTSYTTSSGKKYKFVYGRPVGFAGAEDIISCLDDVGMRGGNLYRLVRSKLVSIGEEEEAAAALEESHRGGPRHSDTLSESEAREREQGMDLVACSVTARRRPSDTSSQAALQEQYVVALLGTDTILDASAIAPSRRRPHVATATAAAAAAVASSNNKNHATNTGSTNNGTNNNDSDHNTSAREAAQMSATQPAPSGEAPSLTSSSAPHGHDARNGQPQHGKKATQKAVATAVNGSESHNGSFDFDFEEEQDYQLFPQEHYSALPAQRKPGAAVPIALCPPSRTLRVPVKYSAVEDRVVAAGAGKGVGDKNKSWRDRVMPQRMFRLATSETRTWAFYNDSEYVMHVYTLFDRASKLEPRDSTRLWPSSVFDDGNEAPTPPPVFFGLFFDEEGEEAVAKSEMPDSVARRPQRIFGTRGMWIAELLVPPRSTRLFVEGKIRGAYRMRCTRLDWDDVVAATAAAQAVAKKRNARQVAERSFFSLRRPGRTSASAKAAAAAAGTATTSASTPAAERKGDGAVNPLTETVEAEEAERRAGAASPSSSTPPALEAGPLSITTPPPARRPPSASLKASPASPHRHGSGANSHTNSGSRRVTDDAASPKPVPGMDCHSTLTESQGVLTRQTYIRDAPATTHAVPATACHRSMTASLDGHRDGNGNGDDAGVGHAAERNPLSAAHTGVVTERLPRRAPAPPPLPHLHAANAHAAATAVPSLVSPVREVGPTHAVGQRGLPDTSPQRGTGTGSSAAATEAALPAAVAKSGGSATTTTATNTRAAPHAEPFSRVSEISGAPSASSNNSSGNEVATTESTTRSGALTMRSLFARGRSSAKAEAAHPPPQQQERQQRGSLDSADGHAREGDDEHTLSVAAGGSAKGRGSGLSSGAENAPHLSPPFSSLVKRTVKRNDPTSSATVTGDRPAVEANGAIENATDSGSDASSSSAEFAHVRPDRQRAASPRDDGLLSSDSARLHRGTSGTDHAHPHSHSPHHSNHHGNSPLGQPTLPVFAAHTPESGSQQHLNPSRPPATSTVMTTTTTPTVSTGGEAEAQRRSRLRPSRGSPRAPEALSPRIHRQQPSKAPCTAGVAGSLDAANGAAAAAAAAENPWPSPESGGTLSTTPWQPKVHTLTPQSSYQSGRFRRTRMPSVSSCRTVAVDDSTGSLKVEEDAEEVVDGVSNPNGHAVPFQRGETSADHGTEL